MAGETANNTSSVQLSPENQAVAERVAATLKIIKYIDALPPEERQSALDALKNSDLKAISHAIVGGTGDAISGVSDGVFALLGKLSSAASGGKSLLPKSIDDAAKGGNVPFAAIGALGDTASGIASDLKAWASRESVSSGGFLGFFKSPLTDAQAEALGVAYATELQKQQNTHTNKNFFEGLQSKEWGRYLLAGFHSITQYVGYAFNQVFGDKTATIRSFDAILNDTYYEEDQKAASKALVGKTIAGVTVSDTLAQFIGKGGIATTKEGEKVDVKKANESGAPTPHDDTSPKALGANNNEPSNAQQVLDGLSSPVGVVTALGATAATVVLGKKAAPHVTAGAKLASNATVSVGSFAAEHATRWGSWFVSLVPSAMKKFTDLMAAPFPSTSGPIKAATDALDKDATKAAQAAVKGNNYSFFERFNGTRANDFAKAKDAYMQAHNAKAGAEMMEALKGKDFSNIATMADERGVFTRIGDRLQGVASWFGRGAESLNTFGKDAGDVIHTQAQRLKFGAAPVSDPAAAAKAAEAIAKTGTTAAPAANAAITATQAAANTLAPVANTAKTVTEVVANVGTTTASGAKLASAATEAATNAGTVAASAAESSGKIASVTKLLRLGRAGGFLTGFFVAGAAGGTAKAMGATTEEATNIAADTAPLVREGKAIAEGRYVEAGHRLIDEVPLLGVAANTLLRPVTRFFGADVDPSIAEAVGEIYTSLTQVKGGQEQNVSPSRPSVPASMPHNTANAAQAFTTGGGW